MRSLQLFTFRDFFFVRDYDNSAYYANSFRQYTRNGFNATQ